MLFIFSFLILFVSFLSRAGSPELNSSSSEVTVICRNGLNKPIHDHQTTLDTILVILPPDSRVLDVNIRIDTVFHSYDSDLRFYLRHLNTGVSFIRNVGSGGDNFIFTNINDSAACAIGSSGCNLPPFSGTFRPTSPATLFPFNYQTVNGIWILAITDTFSMDEGVLKAWCLTITYDNLLPSENNHQNVPDEYTLYQNYPNPFNPSTIIKFDIPPSPLSERRSKGGFIILKIYDILGRQIQTLVNEYLNPGTYEIEWDATSLPGGVYFYRLESAFFTDTKKMLLIK